jgi:Flp pilus assembly protein TadG
MGRSDTARGGEPVKATLVLPPDIVDPAGLFDDETSTLYPCETVRRGNLAEGWGAMLRRTLKNRISYVHKPGDSGDRHHRTASTLPRALRRRMSQSGAAAVEFALVLVPFLVLVFGLMQYGLYFYGAQSGSHVANSAVRQLSVGNCQTAGTLQTYMNGQMGSGLGNPDLTPPTYGVTYKEPAGTTVSTPLPQSAVGGTVTLKFKFSTPNLHFPFLPYLSDSTITRTVEARIEDTTDGGCGT